MINKATSFKVIKEAAMNDFGVKLNNDQCRDIRNASAKGCLCWSNVVRITTQSSEIQFISQTSVRATYGTYSVEEWNAQN